MGRESWAAWVAEYARGHQNRINRACHTVGIPMITLSMLIFAVSFFVPGIWRVALTLFLVGWAFQFAGHIAEGEPPEFFKDPRFLLVGLRWWIAKMRGKA